LLKFGYTFAHNNDLIFLLKPTDKLVGILTASHSVYLSDKGYYHEHLNTIIDKSCSGFNFWILCFLLLSYLAGKYLNKILNKIISIPAALIAAYVLTIFVNTSRIYASIVIHTHTKNILLTQQHIIHEGIGVITNLSFLILAYILFEKLLINKRFNAKFT